MSECNVIETIPVEETQHLFQKLNISHPKSKTDVLLEEIEEFIESGNDKCDIFGEYFLKNIKTRQHEKELFMEKLNEKKPNIILKGYGFNFLSDVEIINPVDYESFAISGYLHPLFLQMKGKINNLYIYLNIYRSNSSTQLEYLEKFLKNISIKKFAIMFYADSFHYFDYDSKIHEKTNCPLVEEVKKMFERCGMEVGRITTKFHDRHHNGDGDMLLKFVSNDIEFIEMQDLNSDTLFNMIMDV